MSVKWTTKITVTNLARRIASMTVTRTETVVDPETSEEVVTVWNKTYQKRRFQQDGKTVPEIRAEYAAEYRADYVADAATAALKAQITKQETLFNSELDALEAE